MTDSAKQTTLLRLRSAEAFCAALAELVERSEDVASEINIEEANLLNRTAYLLWRDWNFREESEKNG